MRRTRTKRTHRSPTSAAQAVPAAQPGALPPRRLQDQGLSLAEPGLTTLERARLRAQLQAATAA